MSDITTTSNVDHKMLQLFLDMQSTQSTGTAKTYKSVIDGFMQFVNKPMAHVVLDDVNKYSKSIAHLAPATQHRMLSTLKSFFNFLSTQPQYLYANVFAAYKLPKLTRTEEVEHILTKDEIERIRDVLRYRNYRNYVIVSILFGTGLRISELLEARWCDISTDFDGNIGLTVIGKGRKKRTVKISKPLFNLIVRYRQQDGLDCTIGSGDITPIFVNRNGTSLTKEYIERVFKEAVKLAKINKPATPHWIRHSHATHALYNGADVYKVKESLGHSSIQTSMRYLHTINKLESTTADYVDMDM